MRRCVDTAFAQVQKSTADTAGAQQRDASVDRPTLGNTVQVDADVRPAVERAAIDGKAARDVCTRRVERETAIALPLRHSVVSAPMSSQRAVGDRA